MALATEEANDGHRVGPNPVNDGKSNTRTAIAAGVALLIIVALIWMYRSWSMAQTATRSDVHAAVQQLDPACRPIVRTRFKSRLVQMGRPLTRAETEEVLDSVHDCVRIAEQVAGLEDQ